MRCFAPIWRRSASSCSAIHGIGPETADAILLYAGGLPTFVVDTYTHRVLARHGWIGYDADYHEIKDYFEITLPADARLYNEYHALLVRVGKEYCRKSAPKCEACPLAAMLPASGIALPDVTHPLALAATPRFFRKRLRPASKSTTVVASSCRTAATSSD